MIEHLNAHDVVRPLLPTPAAAAAFVRDADHEGVRLLFDAYHAAPGRGKSDRWRSERSPTCSGTSSTPTARDAAPRAPARSTSARLVDRLDELGYDGHVGLEFTPAGSSLGWLPKLAPAFRRGAKLG